MRTAIAAALVAATLPIAVQAQDRPALIPTRDVAVTYRIADQDPAVAVTMRWLAAEALMRFDLPGGAGFDVADHRAQRGFMVNAPARTVMNLRAAQAAPLHAGLANAEATRIGSRTIAGHDCTDWRYRPGDREVEACLTAEGVMLAARGNGPGTGAGEMLATQVVFGAQDPALFRKPDGFQAVERPGLLGVSPPAPSR